MSQENQAAQDAAASKMIKKAVTTEESRTYSWICPVKNERIGYTIQAPVEVYFYRGCTTHRVVDASGTVHCVPAVGFYGCALTWKPKAGSPPVEW